MELNISKSISSPLISPIGLFEPNPPFDVKTPEITKAKRAIPITRIKKNDLFLICPSIAIVSNNFRKYNISIIKYYFD